VGTLFLIVCYFRLCLCHFTAIRHLGFEMAIWYWHFVDVVWILVFISIYWWGNSSVNFDSIYNTFESVVDASTFVDYSDTSLIVANVENLIQRIQSLNVNETNDLIESIVNQYYTGSCNLIINGNFINISDLANDIQNLLSEMRANTDIFIKVNNNNEICMDSVILELSQSEGSNLSSIDLSEGASKYF